MYVYWTSLSLGSSHYIPRQVFVVGDTEYKLNVCRRVINKGTFSVFPDITDWRQLVGFVSTDLL